MKIANIRKIGKNRYEIELEKNKKIKILDTIILKYQLLLKKEISLELLEKIQEETKKAEIYETVLRYLNKKNRSRREVKQLLEKEELTEEEKEEMLKKLEEQGFFNEKSYIEAFVHDRINFSNDGPEKIKEELLNLDFDIKDIDEELVKIEESEIEKKLSKLISKKINQNHKYSENYLKQKILEQMLQLGYSRNMIQEHLDQIKLDNHNILKHEAEKLILKYQNKKTGKELSFLLKQKLYQKGYSMNDINAILEQLI